MLIRGSIRQLHSVEDSHCCKAIGRCFCLIAASDGVLRPAEKQILVQLLKRSGKASNEQAEALCAHFRKEERAMGQAMGTVSDAGVVQPAVPAMLSARP